MYLGLEIVEIDFLEPNKAQKNRNVLLTINLIVQFFVETFVAMALGYFIGKYLDKWLFEDQVILTYVFVVIGVFSGLRNMIKRVLRNIDGGKKDEKS